MSSFIALGSGTRHWNVELRGDVELRSGTFVQLDVQLPGPDGRRVRLVVFHYHDRPGGVRQVISRGLPLLVERLGNVHEVVLVMGGMTDAVWLKELQAGLTVIPLRRAVHPDFGYQSGNATGMGGEGRRLMREVLSGTEVLVWAHNLSVGRNIALLKELPDWCAKAGARLWLHHHDWWWDGRWERWADWKISGVESLEEALELSVPTDPHIRHWCVNLADLPWLQSRAGDAARWVGNPLPESALPSSGEVRDADVWLEHLTRGRPVWLAPVRALRRKNPAEALLLMRRTDPGAMLVTTGGPSSPAERPAWEMFCRAAVGKGWPLAPGVLAGAGESAPRVAALMAAASVIVMPSLQEGFGLPYLEAAALGRPLLARALPDVMANLKRLGCTLNGAYESVPVGGDAFEAREEKRRRFKKWAGLRQLLPREMQELMPEDRADFGEDIGIDFGRLTLEAQLEVLESGGGADGGLTTPRVPCWPEDNKGDGWVERFFGEDGGGAGEPGNLQPGGQDVRPSQGSLMPEVARRFEFWRRHPLLWP